MGIFSYTPRAACLQWGFSLTRPVLILSVAGSFYLAEKQKKNTKSEQSLHNWVTLISNLEGDDPWSQHGLQVNVLK